MLPQKALSEGHNTQTNKAGKDEIDGHEVVQGFRENQDQESEQD